MRMNSELPLLLDCGVEGSLPYALELKPTVLDQLIESRSEMMYKRFLDYIGVGQIRIAYFEAIRIVFWGYPCWDSRKPVESG